MPNQDFEFLFVDDGSKDATLAILEKLAQEDSRIKYFSFSRNFGKEAAIYAGLENAQGIFVISKGVLRQLWMRICKIHQL